MDSRVRLLNRLGNEPANLKLLGLEWVDFRHVFDHPGNVVYGNSDGCAIFCRRAPGEYEGHYLLSPRCPDKLAQCRMLVKTLFTLTDASCIVGEVPSNNRVARAMTRALGFAPHGHSTLQDGRPCCVYKLERHEWAKSLAD